jgi:hypothetical protein
MIRRLKAALGVLAITVLTAGCVTTVSGSGRPSTGAGGIVGVGRDIPRVLPDDADFIAALGTSVSDGGFPPSVGSLDMLPDGIRTDQDASEIECLGVTSPFMRKMYENSSVQAVASQRWDNWDKGRSGNYSVDAGAIALKNPADARALFGTFANQWPKCEGKTMILYHAGGGPDQYLQITNVRVTDDMLSAIVMSSSPATHTPASPDERAVGVSMNCIVDVSVSDSSWRTGDPMPQNMAATLAETMLKKITATA